MLCRTVAVLAYLVFVALVLVVFASAQLWLWRSGRGGRVPWALAAALAAIIGAGYFLSAAMAEREEARIQQMVAGFAPTYAQEIERMGHEALTPETDPADPRYLAMIEAQIRWLAVNPSIADVYTLKQLPDGRSAFIVDSETDYDHSGAYDDERELRTAIGEVFEDPDPAMEPAFAGQASFQNEPHTDRWGTWVSAFVPLHDRAGNVDGILGVDYDASLWVGAIARARNVTLAALAFLAILFIGFDTALAILRAQLTERRRAEAQVRGFNAELERRVAASTAELTAANAALTGQIAERIRAQAEGERLHRELLGISRQVGKAEVATGVLHNVGNVLNSVNVSVKLIVDLVRKSKLASAAKLAAILREHQGDLNAFLTADPKGRQIPPYLLTLTDHLVAEQEFLNAELDVLNKHVHHIGQVVSLQQRTARGAGLTETLSAVDLVEDALQIQAASLSRHDILVTREFTPVPAVSADRHKAIQVLVNLIANAEEALAGSQRERRLTLRIAPADAGRVGITVIDNGAGIDADHLPHLFEHGFTTKPDGHGFGLHNSALVAKEMGAALTADSAGRERGAAFALQLPVSDREGPE